MELGKPQTTHPAWFFVKKLFLGPGIWTAPNPRLRNEKRDFLKQNQGIQFACQHRTSMELGKPQTTHPAWFFVKKLFLGRGIWVAPNPRLRNEKRDFLEQNQGIQFACQHRTSMELGKPQTTHPAWFFVKKLFLGRGIWRHPNTRLRNEMRDFLKQNQGIQFACQHRTSMELGKPQTTHPAWFFVKKLFLGRGIWRTPN